MAKLGDMLVNLVFRMLYGSIGIYLCDQLFEYFSMPFYLGINPVTIIGSGVLGIPGIALMFGLNYLW